MGEIAHLKAEATPGPARRPAAFALSTVAAFAGALITTAAVVAGAVLVVIVAATLAFVMVLASLLLGLAAVAWRAQRRPALQGAMVKLRRGGHAWVAYDWDRPAR